MPRHKPRCTSSTLDRDASTVRAQRQQAAAVAERTAHESDPLVAASLARGAPTQRQREVRSKLAAPCRGVHVEAIGSGRRNHHVPGARLDVVAAVAGDAAAKVYVAV